MAARRAFTFMMATAAVVPVLLLSAPAAQADDPPAFDIPISVIPDIVVPPAVTGSATGLSTTVRDLILGFNAGNAAAVNGLFGLVGDVLCSFAAGSSMPCGTGE